MSMMLAQSTTLKEFMRQFRSFSHVAFRARKNDKIDIMSRAFLDSAQRNRVFNVINIFAIHSMKLRMSTSSVVTSVFLCFQLHLYLLRSKSAKGFHFSGFPSEPCRTFEYFTFCGLKTLPVLCIYMLFMGIPVHSCLVTYILTVFLLVSQLIFTGDFVASPCHIPARFAHRIKPVAFLRMSRKKLRSSRQDFNTYGALFHSFSNMIFLDPRFPTCRILAFFTTCAQPIFPAYMASEKIWRFRKHCFTFRALFIARVSKLLRRDFPPCRTFRSAIALFADAFQSVGALFADPKEFSGSREKNQTCGALLLGGRIGYSVHAEDLLMSSATAPDMFSIAGPNHVYLYLKYTINHPPKQVYGGGI